MESAETEIVLSQYLFKVLTVQRVVIVRVLLVDHNDQEAVCGEAIR